ncbi:UDP-N-acetylmuramate--L-alanine ligase, partial [bacterium]|nr:UDP-N-acetylmuramate--L-alanine ligase [bacterium]
MENDKLSFYFCGIGGCGMDPLARLMARDGYVVRGSDIKESPELERLRSEGIECFAAQDGTKLNEGDVFVYSSAIHEDNPDMMRAKEMNLSMLHRSELLAQVARRCKAVTVAGMHGKTTVSSLIAWLMAESGADPSAVIGGFVPDFDGNFRKGKSDYLVLEADESDGTFVRYASTVAVLLNIDADHLDHYKDLADIEKAFAIYVDNIVPGGTLIYNCDDDICCRLAANARPDIRKVRCGLGALALEKADYVGIDIAL